MTIALPGPTEGSYLWWKHHSSMSDHTQTPSVLEVQRGFRQVIVADFLVSCHSRVHGLQRDLVEMGRRTVLTEEPLHGTKMYHVGYML